jgi:hypothetical protein
MSGLNCGVGRLLPMGKVLQGQYPATGSLAPRPKAAACIPLPRLRVTLVLSCWSENSALFRSCVLLFQRVKVSAESNFAPEDDTNRAPEPSWHEACGLRHDVLCSKSLYRAKLKL